jgi:hypothetical protein
LRPNRHFLLPAALLVLGAFIVRLQGLDRGLWLDESWVANSVLSDTWSGMFYYDSWTQSTPPLFLSVVRSVTAITGPSTLGFKLVPFLLGMVAVVLFIVYSNLLFGGYLGLLCATVFAFSHIFCAYSQELKQYTGDLAIAVWILLLLWCYANAGTKRLFQALVATFIVAPFFSFTAILYFPLSLLVIAVQRNTRIRSTAFVVVTGAAFALCYLLFIQPNSTANLRAFYDYPRFSEPATLGPYYLRNTASMLALVVPLPDRLGRLALVLIFFGVIAAIVGSLYPRRNTRRLLIVAFSLVPFLTLIGANAVRQYPYGVARTNLFVLPCVVTVLTLAARVCCDCLLTRVQVRPHCAPRTRSLIACALIVLLTAATAYAMGRRGLSMWEDADTATRYVVRNARKSDLVYVHASSTEQFKLYSRVHGPPAARTVFGDTGWPCCPRSKDLLRTNEDPQYLVHDFESKVIQRIGGVVWLIYTGRRTLYPWKRDEPAFMRSQLQRHGCRLEAVPRFYNFVVDRFSCPQPL